MSKSNTREPGANLSEYAALFGQLYAPSDLPSGAQHTHWLHASPKKRTFYSSAVSGKWCIFRHQTEIDAAWKRVKKAVSSGALTFAKVSTSLGATTRENNHVICVYTLDFNNDTELNKSRTILRELGFSEELGYKRDIDTLNNVYGPDEWFRRST